MVTERSLLLVRYISDAMADCILDDKSLDAWDLIVAPFVFVATSIDAAKRQIEKDVLEELLEDCAGDEQPTDLPLHWHVEDNEYSLMNGNDELLAVATIRPAEIVKED